MMKYVEIEGRPDNAKLKQIERFFASIFGQIDTESFRKRIIEAQNLYIILASDRNRIIGCKIGYEIDSIKFYSWLGGVDSDYRKNGIAQELMKRQHNRCVKKGYKIVRTKTKNSFKPMLILNIKSGFDIVDVYSNSRNELKIVLEKLLNEKI